jgi:hypothetical protein
MPAFLTGSKERPVLMEYNGDRHEGTCPNSKAARKRAEKKPVKSPLVYPGSGKV